MGRKGADAPIMDRVIPAIHVFYYIITSHHRSSSKGLDVKAGSSTRTILKGLQ